MGSKLQLRHMQVPDELVDWTERLEALNRGMGDQVGAVTGTTDRDDVRRVAQLITSYNRQVGPLIIGLTASMATLLQRHNQTGKAAVTPGVPTGPGAAG